MKDQEPQEPTFVSPGESRYNGRSFYAGHGMTSADQAAELHYLRDWKAWAERQLRALYAFERIVSESLNSGDGTYRP